MSFGTAIGQPWDSYGTIRLQLDLYETAIEALGGCYGAVIMEQLWERCVAAMGQL